jgi:integrase
MPKLYRRNQGGKTRYYADLRDIGGGQVALKRPGESRATTDEVEAYQLLAARIQEIQSGVAAAAPGSLGDFAQRFVERNPGDVTDQWLRETALRLEKATAFFGASRPLDSIGPRDVRDWLDRDLRHLAGGTQRHYLHALSGLYRYAQEVEAVPLGYNPVKGLYRKPKAATTRQRTDDFFEIDDAARFLDAAVRLDQHPELVATFLLTGGRRAEVLGLLVGDIDFDAGFVRIQPHPHRRLKRPWSERVVPLWPQLRDFLEPFSSRTPSDLLFPGQTGAMFSDLRKPLGVVADHLSIKTPRLTKFRHTYATARLQTTDNGKQISLWTVAKELGHKTVARVEDTYGHPSHFRPRGEVVEFRV